MHIHSALKHLIVVATLQQTWTAQQKRRRVVLDAGRVDVMRWHMNAHYKVKVVVDWLSMVLRLRQHNIGYTADGFYRSDDPTNSVKALKEGG